MRVPPHWLDCTFYVYPTKDDAKAGTQAGGSGCLVGVPSKHKGWVHLYAVINRHVIDEHCGVLRLNTHDGKMSTIETQYGDWETLDESGDVAARPLNLGPGFRWKAILIEEFISRDIIQEFNIWPGDEVFLIGRLVTQAGVQRNTPVVRFGNISMLAYPDEPIRTKYGDQEGFLIECRSLSGFSGSPVFVTTSQTLRPKDGKPLRERKYTGSPIISGPQTKEESIPAAESPGGSSRIISIDGTFGPWFLGIVWGHVPLWKEVYEKERNTDTGTLSKTQYRVEQNTGIAYIVPAWRIIDLLNKDELVKQRRQDDTEIARDASVPGTKSTE